MADPWLAAALSVLGLAFGSFLNVCIHRLPRHLSVVSPGSACPQCGKPIRFFDNIPVVSWLLLGGRCRDCRSRISARYLVVEVLTGVLFFVCYWHFGLTLAGLKYVVFGWLLLGLIFTDAETQLLPNTMTLPGLALGLGFSWFVPVQDVVSQIAGIAALGHRPAVGWQWLSLADSALGALAGAAFLYGVGAIYLRARGVEGMGMGDVKLMAMVGAFLGLKLTMFTLFTAAMAGSLFGVSTMLVVWMRRTRRFLVRRHSVGIARRRAWKSAKTVYRYYQMPFGVFLCGMALVAVLIGQKLLHWYWGLL